MVVLVSTGHMMAFTDIGTAPEQVSDCDRCFQESSLDPKRAHVHLHMALDSLQPSDLLFSQASHRKRPARVESSLVPRPSDW